MLDIIGSLSLSAILVIDVVVLVGLARVPAGARVISYALAAVWSVAVVVIGAMGGFAPGAMGRAIPGPVLPFCAACVGWTGRLVPMAGLPRGARISAHGRPHRHQCFSHRRSLFRAALGSRPARCAVRAIRRLGRHHHGCRRDSSSADGGARKQRTESCLRNLERLRCARSRRRHHAGGVIGTRNTFPRVCARARHASDVHAPLGGCADHSCAAVPAHACRHRCAPALGEARKGARLNFREKGPGSIFPTFRPNAVPEIN